MADDQFIPSVDEPLPAERFPRGRYYVLLFVLALLVGVIVWFRFQRVPSSDASPKVEQTLEADFLMKSYYVQGRFESLLIQTGPATEGKKGPHRKDSPSETASSAREELRLRAVSAYRDVLKESPHPYFYRRLLLIEDQKGRAETIRNLSKARRPHDVVTDIPEPAKEAEIWRQVFLSKGAMSPMEARRIAATIRRLNLGWYRNIALYHLYQRAGMQTQADAALRKAEGSATSTVVLTSGLMLAMFLTGLVGLGLLIWYASRRARLAPIESVAALQSPEPRRSVVSGYLLEGFVVSILLFILVQGLVPSVVLSFILRHTAQPGVSVMALLTAGVYLLWGVLSAGYLAYRLNGIGLTLADIGLNSKDPGKDVLWGVGSYAASLPLLLLVMAMTQVLSRYVEAPSNPVIPVLVQSEGPLAKVILLLLVGVAAPFFEEILFRGAFFSSLRARWRLIASVVLSAFVFAVVHPILSVFAIMVLGSVFIEKGFNLLPCSSSDFL